MPLGLAANHDRSVMTLTPPIGAPLPGARVSFTVMASPARWVLTTASGDKVKSLWRTAPLWGLGYRVKEERYPTFLHDGRATSLEEAVLWHAGEAAHSKYKFMKLGPRAREALLHWLETL